MTKRSWLKPKEAAEYLHVSYQTLRKYTLEGKLEHDTTPGGLTTVGGFGNTPEIMIKSHILII